MAGQRGFRTTLLSSVAAFTVTAVIGPSAIGSRAVAQDRDTDAEVEIEQMVVTGSRISRSEFQLPTPTVVLGGTDIEESGLNELSEVLTELPSVFTANNPENSQSSTQNSGTATISLRNLGSDRTLILIDGRRTVGNSSTGNVVDLSTIPSGFIERVEVITGGASAVYGSDAVSGVVNLIMKDDFEGLELRGRAGTAEAGGETERGIEVTLGDRILDDRAHLMVNFTWDKEGPILASQRPRLLQPIEIDPDDEGPDELDSGLSSSIPGGRFFGSDFFFDADNQLQTGFNTADDGFNFRAPVTLSIPKERFLLAAKSTIDVTDWLRAFLHVQWSHVNTRSQRAPDTANSSRLDTEFPLLTADGEIHPFIPQPIVDQALAEGETSIDFRRRWTELGNRNRGGDRDTIRLWTGLQGTLMDAYDWELFFGYNEFRQAQNRVGDLVVPKVRDAFDVRRNPETGELECADQRARDGGCVPLNIFGIGAVTEEAAQWIVLQDALRARNREATVGGFISGDLFELPGGPVGFAAGFEYRDVETRTRWDPISNGGLGTVTRQIDQDGAFDVVEGFVETVVPILSEAPFAEYLGVEAAVRFADYSTIGGLTSYKFGGTWQPVSDIRVRGMFARAQRAPNTIELFANPVGSQGNLDDPCDGVTANDTSVVAQNCLGDPVLAPVIQALGGAPFVDADEQAQAPERGNPDLTEERANTITVGGVITPRFAPGLSVSVDYYRIKIKDAIGTFDEDQILEQCYLNATETFGSNPFCGLITRNTLDAQLRLVDIQQININELTASGIDSAVRYDFDLENWGVPGSFSLNAVHSYILALEEELPGLDGPVIDDDRGEVETPRHQARVTLKWAHGPFQVRWKSLILGASVDDNERLDDCIEFDNCDQKLFLNVSAQTYHDIFASYDLPFDTSVRLFFGINNLFDNDPPLLPAGTESGDDENFNSIHDVVGRFYYGGVVLNF